MTSHLGTTRPVSTSPAERQPGGRRAVRGVPQTRLGIISDNHGYLDPAVLELFAGVARIIHAGDFIDPAILAQLATVAPVTAVCGNMDATELCGNLPRETGGELPGVIFVVGHKRKRLLRRLATGEVGGLPGGRMPNLVVFGHDHTPSASWTDGALYLNPGTASSPDEEDDDPTVALVDVLTDGLAVTFVPLARRAAAESADND